MRFTSIDVIVLVVQTYSPVCRMYPTREHYLTQSTLKYLKYGMKKTPKCIQFIVRGEKIDAMLTDRFVKFKSQPDVWSVDFSNTLCKICLLFIELGWSNSPFTVKYWNPANNK